MLYVLEKFGVNTEDDEITEPKHVGDVRDYAYKIKKNSVEIKCQLDATEVFIADLIVRSTCFGHHYAHHQELKSIIQWLLPVVFRAVKM